MELKEIKIAELKELEAITYNDTQKQNSLEKSIRRYGQMQLVVVDKSNNILAGHRIARAMKVLGFDSVHCSVSPNDSKMVGVLLNGIKFDPKDVAIADVIESSKLSKHDLYHSLPFKTYEVDAFRLISEWDWSQYDAKTDKDQVGMFDTPKAEENGAK